MIEAYFRPKDIDEAIAILGRKDGLYKPLGGGVTISQATAERINVVDLQLLGLDKLSRAGQFLTVGATATLQSLAQYPGLQPGLVEAVTQEVNINLRQQATAAGALITAGGRSSYATAMLALDAILTWLPGEVEQSLGEWITLKQAPAGALILSRIQIPLNATLEFVKIARSPDDLPIFCVAAARWPAGRTRIALGGFGRAPILAFDSPEPGGAVQAVQDALSRAEDVWASSEYRQEIGGIIIQRILHQ